MAMNRKRFMATIITLVFLISIVTGMQVVKVAKANPLPPDWMHPKMTITVNSPANGTTNKLPISLSFTAQCSSEFALVNTNNITSKDWIRAFYYVVDNQNMTYLGTNFTEIQTTIDPNNEDNYYDYSGQTNITNLTEGSHTITIYWGVLVNVGTPYLQIVNNPAWSATSQFYVNCTPTQSQTPTTTQSPILSPAPSLGELPYAAGNFTPTPNSTNIPLNTTISISFGRPPSICNLSITPNASIKERIFKAEGYGGTYLFYFSNEQLQPQTTYTVTITYGQETAPEGFKPTTKRTWQFTTGTSTTNPSPTPNSTKSPAAANLQTPALEPIPTPNNTQENFTPIVIIIGIMVVIVAFAGALIYSRKLSNRKRIKQRF